MTPEELKEFREWCRTFEVPADSMIMKALEHIDQQAKQIAALQEIAVRLVAISEYETENWSMRMIPWEEISVEWAEHYKNKARHQLAEEHSEAFR